MVVDGVSVDEVVLGDVDFSVVEVVLVDASVRQFHNAIYESIAHEILVNAAKVE